MKADSEELCPGIPEDTSQPAIERAIKFCRGGVTFWTLKVEELEASIAKNSEDMELECLQQAKAYGRLNTYKFILSKLEIIRDGK